MKIYTGNAFGKKFDKIEKHGLGIMISTHPKTMPSKEFKNTFCALDNGAFSAYTKGYPFPEKAFLKTLDKCFELGIKLDFITCPDIVGGGKKSLEFSLQWADKLMTAPNLALVVQDDKRTKESVLCRKQDMTPEMLRQYNLNNFNHLFVGGTVVWKWNTLKTWVDYAQTKNMKCHVGRCGRLHRMIGCYNLGVDSIDSTSFARNESWHIIEEYRQATGD